MRPRSRESRPGGLQRAPEGSVPLADTIAAFLLTCEAANHTPATRRTYAYNLERFRVSSGTRNLSEVTHEVIEAHLTELHRRMKPVSAHQPFRTLRTFCRWCVRTRRLAADPMAGMTMRLPRPLPRVPTVEDVHRLLATCDQTFEGRRNRAVIGLLADSGLRREEARRLHIADIDLVTLIVHVRAGKGQRDGVTFLGQATASLLRAWLAVHPDPRPTAFIFCTREGLQLGPSALTRILHRLSRRAGLDRLIAPHALRHFAATELLRCSGNLELVRQTLRHSTLATTLRYTALVHADLANRFQAASPTDRLLAGTRGVPSPRTKSPRSLFETVERAP